MRSNRFSLIPLHIPELSSYDCVYIIYILVVQFYAMLTLLFVRKTIFIATAAAVAE